MANNNNIEDLFRKEFSDFKVEPSAGVWNKIATKLWLRNFLSFSILKFNIYYFAAIVVFSGITITNIPKSNRNIETKEISTTSLNKKNNKTITISDNNSTLSENKDTKEVNSTQKTNINRKTTKNTNKNNEKRVSSINIKAETTKKSNVKRIDMDNFTEQKKHELSALFTMDNKNGCPPLTVSFNNLSTQNKTYRWDFGDGRVSYDTTPMHIYTKPGKYAVHLLVTDYTKTAEYVDTITVYTPPKILNSKFAFKTEIGKKTELRVASKGAVSFKWTIDNNIITGQNIEYTFGTVGIKNVQVIAYSKKSCTDTSVLKVEVTDPRYKIEFPNAFRPDKSGPNGGAYIIPDFQNTVFHPVYAKEVSEYKMIIYDRFGKKIFESNDLKIGWDGYFQGKLVPIGVYIYKVQGKFSNGESFFRQGDVTVIY